MIDDSSFLEAIFRDSKDGIYLTDLQGNLIRANKSMLDMTGYTPKDQHTINVRDLYLDPSKRDHLIELMNKEGYVKDFEVRIKTKDDRIRNCLLTANSYNSSDGKLKGFYGIVRDITDKKQDQRKLVEAMERYRTLFDNSIIGIYRTSPDGKILLSNRTLVEMLGYESQKDLNIRNLAYEGFADQEGRKRFKSLMEEKGEVNGLESRWYRKDGSVITVRENCRAIRDRETDEIKFYDGTVEDLSRMKQIQEELSLGKAYFQTLIETAPEGIVVVDMEENVIIVNNKFLEMFGYSREEVLNSKIDTLISSNKKRDECNYLTDIVREGEVISKETLRIKKDGTPVHVSILASPIIHEGKHVASYAIYRDISSRKEIEEKIQNLNESLSYITKVLRHDLMNSLMMIKQAMELGEMDGNYRTDMINSCVKRSISLIETMKELETNIVEGKEYSLVPVEDLLAEIMENINLEYELISNSRFDVKSHVYTVIQNIIFNSLKHGKAKKITVTLDEDEKSNIISLADDGDGIPRDISDRIFEKGFSYGDEKGTGMGLYLTKILMDRYGGTIEHRDNKPRGTIFRITLPKRE